MTFPVDDNGNVRVDFVWGNMAMQPDQGRTYTESPANNDFNQPEDRQWSAPSYARTSDTLPLTVTQYLTFGDQSYDDNYQYPDTRSVTVPTIHDIVTTGYNNFPAYLPNYAGDGDAGLEAVVPDISKLTATEALATISALGIYFNNTGTYIGATVANDGKWKSQDVPVGTLLSAGDTLNAVYYAAPTVPNVVGMTEAAATTALTNAHLTKGAVTTADNAAGATALNDGKIKTQSITAATTVDTGTAVALVKYAYVSPVITTGPIATITNPLGEGLTEATEAWMYLLGQTVKPTVGDFIDVSGNGGTQYNDNNFEVISVANDDAFNTGGTKVKIRSVTGDLAAAGVLGNGGTWTKL